MRTISTCDTGGRVRKMRSDRSGVSGLVIGAAIVVVIIAIVAAILVAYPSLLRGGGGGGSGNWRAGYYVEWDMNYGTDLYYASGYNWTERWTVTSVNETTITVEVRTLQPWYGEPGSPFYVYATHHLTQDMSTFVNMKFDAAHLPSYQTAAFVGNETVSTKWGPITCEHYNVTTSLTSTSWQQFYVWNGVLIKWISADRTIFLTDANVPWFPSP